MIQKSWMIVIYVLFLQAFHCSVNAVDASAAATTQIEAQNPAIQRLFEYAKSHEEFKNLYFKLHEQEFVRLVKEGQSPKALFIGCSDSRVVPDLITVSNPGDLFVIRTAGNFVPPYDPKIAWDGVAATLQYAIEVLGITDVIVCGHSHCGAIKGVFAEKEKSGGETDMLSKWLQFGMPAKKMVLLSAAPDTSSSEKYALAERISVLFQLENLLTYPFVKEKVAAQKVFLHGWYFEIETGRIDYYDPASFKFVPLTNLLQLKSAQ